MVYCVVEVAGEGQMLVAEERLEALREHLKDKTVKEIIMGIPGSALVEEAVEYINPISGKTSRIIHASLVTASTGTGLVHLAAGHGLDDYLALQASGFKDVFAPVDDEGKFTADACPSDPERLKGLYVESKGAKAVLEILTTPSSNLPHNTHKGLSLVLSSYKYTHKNPIDWRTKQPVIVRATNQWFADVGSIQDTAIESLREVTFVPETGRNRLKSFLQGRRQWCISRQRSWGVPIPALHRRDTGEAVMTPESIEHIITVIKKRGVDAWWSDAADEPAWVPESLPPAEYVRGQDTMDVWFDSGTSWTNLKARDGRPAADVYLEGTDQHRGWFQSSVLTYIAAQDTAKSAVTAPFGTLITHGFTLDSTGHKMSKSIGNVVSPAEILRGVISSRASGSSKKAGPTPPANPSTLGPDALRLWVSAADYTRDMSVSQPSVAAAHQALSKYRVTFKFLLGVLATYPHGTPQPKLAQPLSFADHTLLRALQDTSAAVLAAQSSDGRYDFGAGLQLINRFVNVDLSARYVESVKDTLYCGDEEARLHVQTVLALVLEELLSLLAPVTPLLVEEVFAATSKKWRRNHLHPLQEIRTEPFAMVKYEDAEDQAAHKRRMEFIAGVTAAVKSAQEKARLAGKLRNGLNSASTLR